MHARNEEFLHASRVTRPRIWTGLLLNESYRVGSLIEQGATTELYDGIEVSTGEPVALKILLPQLADDTKTRTLFLDEARVLTRLSQPGVHRYRSCARDPQSDLTYIVTEMIGARLSSRLGSRRMSQQDIVDFTKRIALALGAAHRAGLVHRNLRPHAIALPDGRLADAVVTDFNLIKAAHSGRNRDFDGAMLDRAFCAPEQVNTTNAAEAIGPWTDIYSLALVVLAAIGAKSAEAETPPDLSLLPRKLRPVFERMLEPKPTRRLQSMDDVVRQLDLAAGSAPLRNLLERAPSVSLPSFRRTTRETAPAKPAPAVAAASPEMPIVLPSRKTLPPLPASLLPAKNIPLANFHETRAASTRLDLGRAVLGAVVLFLAASPWIIQTSFPGAPADASTVAPTAQTQRAARQSESKADQAARAFAALPKGQVYGADNIYSRVTLRAHRPTRVTVHSRGERLLFSRVLQPGDAYRTPSLPGLMVTAEDAGAVEVVLNGASAGFAGENGAPIALAPLSRLASLAPPSSTKASTTSAEPTLPSKEAEAVSRGIAAIEDAGSPTERVQAADQADAPTEQAAAISEPLETPLILQEAATPLPTEPERTIATQIAPRAAEMRDIPLPSVPVSIPAHPVPQQVVIPPAEPETTARRRPVLDLIIPWRRSPAAPEPAPVTLSKEAVEGANARADRAKAAVDNRTRNRSFFNSTLGVTAPY